MKKRSFLFAAAALIALAGFSTTTRATTSLPLPNLVTPGDTFSFDILAYNTASGNGYFVAEGVATFGATNTFTGYDGNTVTVISNETTTGTSTTDTFTISTPTNFYAETTLNGLTITGFELDLGNANSGAATTGTANPVDLVLPIGTYTTAGSAVYQTNTNLPLNPATTLSNNNLAYAAVEGLQSGTNAINQYTVHSFSYSITYTNAVPEPSTYALCALGLAGFAGVVVRRRRQAQA